MELRKFRGKKQGRRKEKRLEKPIFREDDN